MNAEERTLTKAINDAKAVIAQQKANMRFARLPAAKKRVVAAKEVLSILNLPRGLQPIIQSAYIRVNGPATQEQFCKDMSGCTVCGIGSLVLAHFRLFNSVPKKEELNAFNFKSIGHTLKGYFSERQLSLIESAFEGSDVHINKALPAEVDSICVWREYGWSVGQTACIREIMRNLVRNNGTFNIHETPDIPQ